MKKLLIVILALILLSTVQAAEIAYEGWLYNNKNFICQILIYKLIFVRE